METTSLVCLIVLLTCYVQICTTKNETYSLIIKSKGPAVIDSVISIQANLYKKHAFQDSGSNQTSYLYVWKTNACLHSQIPSICDVNITSNDCAELKHAYTKFDVQRGGEYLMMVAVYKKDVNATYVQIAANSTNFNLTDTINGWLSYGQNVTTGLRHPTDVFSTSSNITLTATITDHFSNPVFISVWCIVGPQTNITHEMFGLSYSLPLPQRGKYKLFVAVIVRVSVVDQVGKEHLVERNTSFSGHVLMKDPVSNISLLGSSTYTVGSNLSADVVCSGSAPFYLTLILIDPLQSVIQEVQETSNICYLHITQPDLDILGKYSINVTIENDISRLTNVIDVHVTKEFPPGYGAIVPAFAVIISVLAPGIILYSYYLDRQRQRSVEYADFSFREEGDNAHHQQEGILNKIHLAVKMAGSKIHGKNASQIVNNNTCAVKMKTMVGSYEAIT